eukprot:162799_1
MTSIGCIVCCNSFRESNASHHNSNTLHLLKPCDLYGSFQLPITWDQDTYNICTYISALYMFRIPDVHVSDCIQLVCIRFHCIHSFAWIPRLLFADAQYYYTPFFKAE